MVKIRSVFLFTFLFIAIDYTISRDSKGSTDQSYHRSLLKRLQSITTKRVELKRLVETVENDIVKAHHEISDSSSSLAKKGKAAQNTEDIMDTIHLLNLNEMDRKTRINEMAETIATHLLVSAVVKQEQDSSTHEVNNNEERREHQKRRAEILEAVYSYDSATATAYQHHGRNLGPLSVLTITLNILIRLIGSFMELAVFLVTTVQPVYLVLGTMKIILGLIFDVLNVLLFGVRNMSKEEVEEQVDQALIAVGNQANIYIEEENSGRDDDANTGFSIIHEEVDRSTDVIIETSKLEGEEEESNGRWWNKNRNNRKERNNRGDRQRFLQTEKSTVEEQYLKSVHKKYTIFGNDFEDEEDSFNVILSDTQVKREATILYGILGYFLGDGDLFSSAQFSTVAYHYLS